MSFRVLQYNIYFGKLDTDTGNDIVNRVADLCDQIQTIDADFICLQEVLPERYELIKQLLGDTYRYRYPETICQAYDAVILSKHHIVSRVRIDYTVSNMGRSLLWAEIDCDDIDGIDNLAIATSHFESVFDNIDTKLSQYTECVDLLSQLSQSRCIDNVVIGADFNTGCNASNDHLNELFNTTYRDCWVETDCDNDKCGTYDSRRNNFLQYYSKKNLEKYGSVRQYVSRVDRIAYHSESFCTSNFDMPIDARYISDHFPIVANFSKTDFITDDETVDGEIVDGDSSYDVSKSVWAPTNVDPYTVITRADLNRPVDITQSLFARATQVSNS